MNELNPLIRYCRCFVRRDEMATASLFWRKVFSGDAPAIACDPIDEGSYCRRSRDHLAGTR
jgi:hypothetical protein